MTSYVASFILAWLSISHSFLTSKNIKNSDPDISQCLHKQINYIYEEEKVKLNIQYMANPP